MPLSPEAPSKKCCRCGESRPLEEYARAGAHRIGRCRKCESARRQRQRSRAFRREFRTARRLVRRAPDMAAMNELLRPFLRIHGGSKRVARRLARELDRASQPPCDITFTLPVYEFVTTLMVGHGPQWPRRRA